ncbi:hypothetical protein AAFF_G00225740 [Aldrovandia affinis]|uniref:FYVE-type domain-containing protein n=1 Tax=Aldrovandia affinis TaxID=143900 RepID=A0AAD7X1J0_9TELE|nr:hypothetical protein AAFF_G00225740 [Aldrovandia affinis]
MGVTVAKECIRYAMVDHLAFMEQNTERIRAVQALFGSMGKPLVQPGRVLVGEGHLLKLCRRCPKLKAFFLFNDILMYGSVLLRSRWYASQQVVPLEDVALEDMEDGLNMSNQWLIRTPRKSFYCRAERLRQTGRPPADRFAAVWIPDRASAICMRCCVRFTMTQRRHHCRRCGFVVCTSCSRDRFLILDISARPVRVCPPCHWALWTQDPGKDQTAQTRTQMDRGHGDCEGKDLPVEDELATPVYELSSDEEHDGGGYDDPAPSQWVEPQNHIRKSSWSPYIDLKNYLQTADLGNF